MKKLFIPLICSLIAAWSCNMEGTYYAENMQDIVTILEHKLVNESGVVYNVTEKGNSLLEMEEGERYFIVFDILNRNLDIRLTNVLPVSIKSAAPVPTEEITAHDPVSLLFSSIGPKYMDLGFNYQCAKNSNYAHTLTFYYTLNNADSQLNLFLYHDGNDENLSKMSAKDLETRTSIISIPISQWQNVKEVTLTCDILAQDASTGAYSVVRHTFGTDYVD